MKLHYEPHLFHHYCRKNVPETVKMGKAKQISTEKRAQIVIFSKEGRSQRYIAQFVGVSKTTVQYTLQRYDETGSYSDRKRSGRPRKTTKIDDRRIRVISKRSDSKQRQIFELRSMHRCQSQFKIQRWHAAFMKSDSMAVLLPKNHCYGYQTLRKNWNWQNNTSIGQLNNGNKCFGRMSLNSKFSGANAEHTPVERLTNGTKNTVSSHLWSLAVVQWWFEIVFVMMESATSLKSMANCEKRSITAFSSKMSFRQVSVLLVRASFFNKSTTLNTRRYCVPII